MRRLSFILLLILAPSCAQVDLQPAPEDYLELANNARERAVYARERMEETFQKGAIYRERWNQKTLAEQEAEYEEALRDSLRNNKPEPFPGFFRWFFVKKNDWEYAAESWEETSNNWASSASYWEEVAIALTMRLEAEDMIDSIGTVIAKERQAEMSREYLRMMTEAEEQAKYYEVEAESWQNEAAIYEAEAEMADTLKSLYGYWR